MINGRIINNKILVHTAQWYITHTCNLTCSHCLSFNNFAIAGHDEFENNMDAAKHWNQLITIKDFTIVGGETFTHNNLDDWAVGLREIFSDVKDFKIITNGTLLTKYADKFNKWFDLDIVIEISFKNIKDYQTLQKILSTYNNVEIKSHFMYDQAIYIDNKLRFLIEFCEYHTPWAVKSKTKNKYEFWKTDKEAAHKKCWQKYCHYFYQGQLYKCGTIVGAREFVQKYQVDTNCKELYLDYKPINYYDNNLLDKIVSLNNAVSQCEMCPVASPQEQIIIDNKKILP